MLKLNLELKNIKYNFLFFIFYQFKDQFQLKKERKKESGG